MGRKFIAQGVSRRNSGETSASPIGATGPTSPERRKVLRPDGACDPAFQPPRARALGYETCVALRLRKTENPW